MMAFLIWFCWSISQMCSLPACPPFLTQHHHIARMLPLRGTCHTACARVSHAQHTALCRQATGKECPGQLGLTLPMPNAVAERHEPAGVRVVAGVGRERLLRPEDSICMVMAPRSAACTHSKQRRAGAIHTVAGAS